jgi:hypothetical protein
LRFFLGERQHPAWRILLRLGRTSAIYIVHRMKSILTLTVFGLLTVSSIGHAQDKRDKIEIGLRFIPQATTFRYTQGVGPIVDFLKISAPYYQRIRTAQGVGLTYNPLQRLRLGADVLYSLQGGGYEQRKTNLNYLKIPFWIGYNSTVRRRIIFTIQSGVELSYLVSAKMKYPEGKPVFISHYVNRISLGIPFAMGIKFKVYRSYFLSVQLYVYSDLNTLAKTNNTFGVYNYVFPGLRMSVDQSLTVFKKRK